MHLRAIQVVVVSCLAASPALLPSAILANAFPTGKSNDPCPTPDGPETEPPSAPRHGPNPETSINVDVAIVGGGFSGMTAAYQLHQAGLKVVVLEATDVLGGRSRSHPLETGPGLVELGATWISSKTQPQVTALAEEFGLELVEQYSEGYGVREMLDGTVTLEGGDDAAEEEEAIEEMDPEVVAALMTVDDFIAAVTAAERQIDLRVFDEFPVEEDVSFEDWILRNESWDNPFVHANARQLTTSIVGREPCDVGAHYWFDYLRSGRGLESLLGDDVNGAQRHMIKTGTTSIVTSIRDALPANSVLTNAPVTQIAQKADEGTISLSTSSSLHISARKAILAIMPSTYNLITFSPPLPPAKQALSAASLKGQYDKLLISYPSPWWREANLTGQFFSYTGPVTYSLETSVPELDQFSLACFIAGDFALEWFALPSQKAKEEAVVAHLARMAGAVDAALAPAAKKYSEINLVEWRQEPWIGGGPTNAMGPGDLREFGQVLREAVSGVHFAGTETAFEWKGYLEGAVRAGKRAAGEVVEALK